MDKVSPDRGKTRNYTVTALLGLFVVAAVLALAGRLLPGGLSRMIGRLRRHDETAASGRS